MSEPTRWLDGRAPAGARALLRAGLDETPSQRVLQRTLVAVSATAVTSTAMGGALGATVHSAGASSLVFAAKCAVVGVASASIMLGAAAGIHRYRAKSAAIQPRTTTAVERRVAANPLSVAATPQTKELESPLPRDKTTPQAQVVALPYQATRVDLPIPRRAIAPISTSQPGHAPATASAAPTRSELVLAEEIAMVDAARLRLRAGDAAGALEHINEYDRRSDFGRFAPEALAIRMEAQMQLGNRLAAAAAAREMVFRYQRAPQVRRATEILDALGAVKDF